MGLSENREPPILIVIVFDVSMALPDIPINARLQVRLQHLAASVPIENVLLSTGMDSLDEPSKPPPTAHRYQLIIDSLAIQPVFLRQVYHQEQGNQLTAGLCKGDKSEIAISRLRDKKLVFVGLVQKCLQHGHPFRMAGVWLKLKKMWFTCSSAKKH